MKKRLLRFSILFTILLGLITLIVYRLNTTTLVFGNAHPIDKGFESHSTTGYIIYMDKNIVGNFLHSRILVGQTNDYSNIERFIKADKEGMVPWFDLEDTFNIKPVSFTIPANDETEQLKLEDKVKVYYKSKISHDGLTVGLSSGVQTETATKMVIYK